MFDSTERWMSGLSRTPGKRVYVNSVSRVRIPSSLPVTKDTAYSGVFFALILRRYKLRPLQKISLLTKSDT